MGLMERPRITVEQFNALPENVRRYCMYLETDADPAGTIRSEMMLRDQVEALELRVNEIDTVIQEAIRYHDDGNDDRAWELLRSLY
jgi:hypothetical protein